MTDQPKGPRVHVNTATLLMGQTGSGKTTLLATLALWVWKTYGKTTLFYTTDGGGFPDLMTALIQHGIVRLWRLRTRSGYDGELGFETAYRAAEGWWPARIRPESGECEPDAVLLPPVVASWDIVDPTGEVLATAHKQDQVADKIKTLPNPNTLRAVRTSRRTQGLEDVGAVVYDGLTSMSTWWEDQLAERQGKRQLAGEQAAIGGIVVSGSISIGGGNRSHVGFSQKRANQMVNLSLTIPHLVVPPVWTALTNEASDDRGLPICGPQLSGQAKTAEAPAWFGNTLESFKGVVPNTNNVTRWELRTAEFFDAEGRKHKCKHRGSPDAIPEILHDPYDAQGVVSKEDRYTQFNLGRFFELMLEAQQVSEQWVVEQLQGAGPGLASGTLEDTDALAQGTTRVQSPAAGAGQRGPTVVQARPAMSHGGAPVMGAPVMRPKAAAAAPKATAAPAPAPVPTGRMSAPPPAPTGKAPAPAPLRQPAKAPVTPR